MYADYRNHMQNYKVNSLSQWECTLCLGSNLGLFKSNIHLAWYLTSLILDFYKFGALRSFYYVSFFSGLSYTIQVTATFLTLIKHD